MKYTIGLIIVIFIAAGTFFYTRSGETHSSIQESRRSMAQTYDWKFEEITSANAGTPHTKVSLVVSGGVNKTYDLGVVDGSCSESVELLDGEVSAALCWWGGAGPEFGVFSEEEGFVVKKGMQGEGSAEEPGFRGDFKTLFVVGQ